MKHTMDKMAIGREKDTHGEDLRMHAHEHARLLYQKGEGFRLHTSFHTFGFKDWDFMYLEHFQFDNASRFSFWLHF